MKTFDITVTRIIEDGNKLYNLRGSTAYGREVITENFGVVKGVEVESVNVTANCLFKFWDRACDFAAFEFIDIPVLNSAAKS